MNPPIPTETLLHELAALRPLARALARDESDAAPPDRLMAVARGSLPAILERGAGPWPPTVTLQLTEDPLTLGGIVLGPDGEPVPDAEVWIDRPTTFGSWNGGFSVAENLIRGSTSLQHGARADADGRFLIDGLIRRDYEVHALIPRLAWAIVAGTYAAGRQDLVIRFPNDGLIRRLEGRVVDMSGTPVPSASVQSQVVMLAAEDPVSHQRFANVRQGSRATTDEHGLFVLQDVPRDASLTVQGKGISGADEYPVPADGRWAELQVARTCELRIDNPVGAGEARTFQLVDAAGEAVDLRRISGNLFETFTTAPLANGRSEVLLTTDRAAALVLFDTAGNESGRVLIRLSPVELNVIR